jgi:hypothetical protein
VEHHNKRRRDVLDERREHVFAKPIAVPEGDELEQGHVVRGRFLSETDVTVPLSRECQRSIAKNGCSGQEPRGDGCQLTQSRLEMTMIVRDPARPGA